MNNPKNTSKRKHLLVGQEIQIKETPLTMGLCAPNEKQSEQKIDWKRVLFHKKVAFGTAKDDGWLWAFKAFFCC